MKFDLEEIKTLIDALEAAGLSKLKLRQGDAELTLERRLEGVASLVAPASLPTIPQAPPQLGKKPAEEEEIGTFSTSPIVGTFYRSPSPETDPFVEVGDSVTEQTVVCIVEAMKVMNEVKAGVKGVVKEIMVENGDPVEFGTKLFRVE